MGLHSAPTKSGLNTPAVLTVVGLILVMAGLVPFLFQRLTDSSSSGAISGPGTPNPPPAAKYGAEKLPRDVQMSRPQAVSIPTLHLKAGVTPLSVSDTGELGVPAEPDQVGYWYRPATHGTKVRPTVLVGHLDSLTGPAVFYELASLIPGDVVVIRDANGQRIAYSVTNVVEVPRDTFPANRVYGMANHPQLRLLTCAGDYDGSEYANNTIVYARAANS